MNKTRGITTCKLEKSREHKLVHFFTRILNSLKVITEEVHYFDKYICGPTQNTMKDPLLNYDLLCPSFNLLK